MIWLRKGLVSLLSLIFLLALLGGALAASFDSAFSHQDKVEAWLSQSNIYSRFVSNAVSQAQKSTGGSSNTVSLNDVAVQQAANAAFPPQQLQEDANLVLNSNYAWLEGKTSKPDFAINLSSAKQSFAKQVGQYVQTYLSGLPVCTATQLSQIQNLQNADPLTLSCRPNFVSPGAEGSQITQKIGSSGDFLSNPVITANTISPNKSGQSQPYYQRFSTAPKVYRAAVKLPWMLAGLAVLSAIAIFFTALRRRAGLRRIGEVLLLAGVLLVLVKFAADYAFKHFEAKIFNNSSVGQMQQSLTDFINLAKIQLVKIDMWFGIAFLIMAAVIFIILLITHRRAAKTVRAEPANDSQKLSTTPPSSTPQPSAKAANNYQTPPPDRPKRSRLIQ